MHHIAILRKAKIKKGDNLLEDILLGTKTIESRWYVNKIAPWNKVNPGDIVYFKESGRPVTVQATISKVLQYENLNQTAIHDIISNYGHQIAPSASPESWKLWAQKQQNKHYCILVFLSDVKKIDPFNIDKTGYGSSAAWLVTEDISEIKLKNS